MPAGPLGAQILGADVRRGLLATADGEPVNDKQGLMEFVGFPFKLYRGDPNWVPPLIEERRDFLTPRKTPSSNTRGASCSWRAGAMSWSAPSPLVVNDNHNTFHDEKTGSFGFFEAINDQAVADALLEAAEAWVRAQGMAVIRGPLNFSTNDEIGTLVDGFDEPPVVMMTYNPRYYPSLIEAHGYTKAMDVYAYIVDLAEGLQNAPPKVFSVAEKAAQKEGIRVRKLDIKRFDQEVALLKQVYNRAWERNWGFVPMTDAEIDHLAHGLKAILDPNLLFVAETADGTPVGVSIAIPDIHQALRWSGGGHMWPFGLLKFLWHRRKVLVSSTVSRRPCREPASRDASALRWSMASVMSGRERDSVPASEQQ